MALVPTYTYPLAGATASTNPASMVLGTYAWLDADTTGVITHNMAISATDLTAGFPIVTISTDPTSTGTVNAVRTITTATNTVTVAKTAGAGTGGVFKFVIERPNTLVR